MSTLSFDIKTTADFFRKLLADYNEYIQDKTSSRIALNCAMTAWHMTDWIYNEYNNIFLKQFNELKNFHRNIKEKCPSLQIMQDLANGTKHYMLTRHNPIVKETELHLGAFDNSFSRAFDISTLDIELNDGTKIFFEDELNKVIIFWREYLHTELGLTIQ